MIYKTLLSLILVLLSSKAYPFLGWFDSLSPKAERAKNVLAGFDEKIEQALKDFDVPGMAVGIVVDGHVIFSKGFGYRDLDSKQPVTTDTIFGIGSCSKAFSTFAMGTLVEDGSMDWDQPVVDFLPEFRLWNQYATQNVTIRDLVTHRSGMARHGWTWYNSHCTREDLLKRLRYLEPACDIRERFVYGDLMYMVAGMVVERVANKPWEQVISDKILQPLEMKRTNFSVETSKADSNHAIPYIEKNDTLKRMSFRDFSVIGGGGGMNSTVNDLSKWVKMLLAQGNYGERSLISSAAIQEMFAGQAIVSGYAEWKDLLINAYGLGWGIQSYRGHYQVSHDGGVDGFTSVVGVLPYDGIGVVVLANKNLTVVPRLIAFEALDRLLELPVRNWLKEGLEQLQNGKKAAEENIESEAMHRKKGTTPSHPLEDFVGEYDHPGYGRVVVELVDGKLQATYNHITSYLEHWHYDVFSVAEESEDLLVSRIGTKFTFRNNLNGDVEELLIPFEPKTKDICFKKVPDSHLTNLNYFRQFVGSYEIYNVFVDIVIRDHSLLAIIPGQPIFELLPLSENEFSVKSMASYTVRFLKDDADNVKEVLLVLPYGAYSAKKTR